MKCNQQEKIKAYRNGELLKKESDMLMNTSSQLLSIYESLDKDPKAAQAQLKNTIDELLTRK